MSTPAFGLYSARAMAAAQRIAVGARLDLQTPRTLAGVTRFASSLWLPVPAGLLGDARTQALHAVGALAWRFDATRYTVDTSDSTWFSAATDLDDDTVRLTLTWPASVVRIGLQAGNKANSRDIELRRVDGDAVATAAAATGSSGRDLTEPWVGSPFEIHLGDFNGLVRASGLLANLRAGPAGTGTPIAVGQGEVIQLVGLLQRIDSAVVPTVTLAGRPTSPRLSLVAEQPHGETLLWQALRPGEQAAAVTLPGMPLTEAWAPALDQLRRLWADPTTRPLRLRLDLVSDAPCSVTATALSLALEAELELLDEPQRLDFDGLQAATRPLPLTLPAAAALTGARSLALHARWVGDGGAAVGGGAAPGDPRRGAWAEPGRTLQQALDLHTPLRCEGAAWFGQALGGGSDEAAGEGSGEGSSEGSGLASALRVRLLADGGSGPAAHVLAEQADPATASSPSAGWQAARWPAVDLQPQRVWLELTVRDGAALWAFGATDAAVASAGPAVLDAGGGARQVLPEALGAQLLVSATQAGAAAGSAIEARLGATRLDWRAPLDDTPAVDDAELRLALTAPQAAALATMPLTFSAGSRGSLHVESVRLVVTG